MERRQQTTRTWALALLTPVLVAGCLGGLDNEIFAGTGSVQGQLSGELDPASAWITVEGQPELVAAVAADGSFELAGVAAGETTLLGSTGLGEAVRQQLTVLAREHNRVQLQAGPGARMEGSVSLAGDDLARRPEVGFVELPVQLKTAVNGEVLLDGLPAGCFELWASHPTHQRIARELCLRAGETATFSFRLARSEGNGGAPVELCAPCSGDGDCASGQCVSTGSAGSDEQVCTRSCVVEEDCPLGYSCEELEGGNGERICLPRELSCSAQANLGAPCDEDLDCGLDAEDGHCVDGRCLASCEEAHDCPAGTQCQIEIGDHEGYCR